MWRPPEDTLEGSYELTVVGETWVQRGYLTDWSGNRTTFTAIARFVPDSASGCTVSAGTLTGRLGLGA
jgi:hypothetical protein